MSGNRPRKMKNRDLYVGSAEWGTCKDQTRVTELWIKRNNTEGWGTRDAETGVTKSLYDEHLKHQPPFLTLQSPSRKKQGVYSLGKVEARGSKTNISTAHGGYEALEWRHQDEVQVRTLNSGRQKPFPDSDLNRLVPRGRRANNSSSPVELAQQKRLGDNNIWGLLVAHLDPCPFTPK